MSTIRLYDPIGAEVTLHVPGDSAEEVAANARAIQRAYGERGYTPFISPPPGGLRFPLANADDFDWRLLGARPFTTTLKGEKRPAVMFRGRTYVRREPPVTTRTPERIVKYSAGASRTDARQAVEGEEGKDRYVTLIIFRGGARKMENYAVEPAPRAPGQPDDQPTVGRNSVPTPESDPSPAEQAPPRNEPQRSLIADATAEQQPALIAYIKAIGAVEIGDDATIRLNGRKRNLKEFVREQWKKLPNDLELTRTLALAIEENARTRFDPIRHT